MMDARTLTMSNAHQLAFWCCGVVVEERDALDETLTQPGINVPCGDDVKRASLGDVIIHKTDGTFNVLKAG